jgi:MFS family permease
MMDELDLLKRDWQAKEVNVPRLTYDEIYRMIWRKSSSVVRWIFYISIIEFLLPHLLYLIPSFRDEMNYDFARRLGIHGWIIALTVLQYAVAVYFIFQFYRRYREISVLDDAKKLMGKIFRTRRTVKHYVLFCLGMVLLMFAVFILGMALDDDLAATLNLNTDKVDADQLKWVLIGVMALAGIVFTAILAGIYFLLYGLLTRKLKRNYGELRRMEA